MHKKIKLRTKRRFFRVKNKFKSKGLIPRVTVFRSLNHIYAQVIDDANGKTIASSSSLIIKEKTEDKKSVAKNVGINLATKMKETGVEAVFFDRGRYQYHGRIAALADGLRETGIKF
ncbi:50S ribosomal protein L18 [Candidatus Babeliales bacterium]|nr:50S ribosomal protein L18 [Candidatus Babeliales bacterium]